MPGTRFNLTITSSGGEVPGEATVWGAVNDWEALDTIPGPLRVGDRVEVTDLQPGLAYAARYSGGGGWELAQAAFPSVDDMLAFNEPIFTSATAIVGSGLETDPVYYYDGDAWVRTPEDTKYIWPDKANWGDLDLITEPQDGDEVYVEFLGISTSYGIAKWSETAVDWELQEVTYSGWDPYGFSDVFVTIGTIANGALLRSDDGSQGAPIYFWNSTGSDWVRSPEDVAYTWSPVTLTNWAGLTSLQGILAGDRAEVGTWTTGGTAGVARYDGTDWRLVEGVVDTIANLVAFTGLKEPGAKVTVGTGISANPVYFWDTSVSPAQWLRTAHQSHYIWPQINYWSQLTSLRPHAINDDEVHLNSLGPPHSNGTAQKHSSTWKLIEGKWTSVSDMNSWPTADIHSGAIAFIDPTHQYDENSTVYYYTGGAWVQTGPPSGATVFTLTSLRDFTGSGLTDGDYGYYGNTVYRYKASVPISSGGTDPMWLPPAVYAGTLSIRGRLVGTEAIGAMPVTVGGIAFAVAQNPSAGSTVTQSGDYIQMQTTTSTNNIFYGNALFTIGSAIRTYMQCDISVTYTGTAGALARVLCSEGNGQPAWWFHLGPSGSLSPLPYFANGTVLQGSQEAIREGGIAFPSNASGIYSTTEFIDSGRNMATECFRDGVSYARSRRSSTSSTGPTSPTAGVGFYVQANAFGAGGTLTIRVKNWRILTW